MENLGFSAQLGYGPEKALNTNYKYKMLKKKQKTQKLKQLTANQKYQQRRVISATCDAPIYYMGQLFTP